MRKQTRRHIVISSYDDMNNPYYAGGGAFVVSRMAETLSEQYKVTIISAKYPNARNKKKNNIIYKYIGLSFTGPKIGQLIYSALLPLYVLTLSYDVWIESLTPPFSSSFLPLFTSKKIIGLVHMLSGRDMERKYKLPFRKVERWALQKYSNFIVLTEQVKNEISLYNPAATFYQIPNGITLQQPRMRARNNTFLFIGRIEYDQKGLDLLLDAFKTVAKKYQAHLVIAGNGIHKDIHTLKQKIADNKLGSVVTLAGRVGKKDKDLLFSSCRAVIIPSRFETFSLTALEGLSYRKPVIGFDIDGLSWIPNDCMVKVTPYSIRKLSAAIEQVLQSPKESAKIAQRGFNFSKNFSWDLIESKYLQTIQEVLHSG